MYLWNVMGGLLLIKLQFVVQLIDEKCVCAVRTDYCH
jgi:hypothetical protein